jgi:hypothetical protein
MQRLLLTVLVVGWWVLALTSLVVVLALFHALAGDGPMLVLGEQLAGAAGGLRPLVLLAGVGFATAALIGHLLRRARQAKNDRHASRILERARTGEGSIGETVFVYARAFETTGRLGAPQFIRWRLRLRPSELESLIAAALSRVGSLVALGRPGEHAGAGRVSTADEDWRRDFTGVVAHAAGVLLV